MMYDTHKRYGQVAGIVALPVAVNYGVVDFGGVTSGSMVDMMSSGMVMAVITLIVAFFGVKFGAEFPDIDSYNSKAAKHHRILREVFKAAGVKHRGRFTHDFVVQTAMWAAIYYGVTLLGDVAVGSALFVTIVAMMKVYVFFTFVGVMSHLVADAMTVDGVWFGLVIKVRFMPVFIKHVNILGWKPFKKWFTAGSAWNDMNYRFMTLMIPVAAVFVGFNLFV